MAYKTLVRPQVEYASVVWSPYTQQQNHKVEMVQRRAVRWVSNNYSTYESVSGKQEKLGHFIIEKLMLVWPCSTRLSTGLWRLHHPYLKHPSRITRHMHSLSCHQIFISVNYHKYSFFPASIMKYSPVAHCLTK